MSGSTGTQPPAEWYLARDGQQFGPLSDAELKKLVEFGHLKPTDLLWREGFPDWRSARILLPNTPPAEAVRPPSAAAPQAAAQTTSQPTAQPQSPAQTADPQTRPIQAHQPNHQPPQNRAPQAPLQQRSPHPGGVPGQYPNQQPQPLTSQKPGNWQQQPWPQEPVSQQPQQQSHLPPPAQRPPQGAVSVEQPRAPIMPGPRPQPVQQPGPTPAPRQVAVPQRPPHAQQNGQQPNSQLASAGSAYPAQRSAEPAFDDYDDEFDEHPERGGSRVVLWMKRAAVFIFFASTLSAATWYAYPHRDRIMSMATAVTTFGGSSEKNSTVSPIVGFAATTEATDQALQKTTLWRTLKRDFPDWYASRLKEAADLAREQKSDAVIGQKMMESVVALRRQHAGDALSAPPPRIKAIAAAFAENLTRLRGMSVEACFGYISNGETSSSYLQLLAQPDHTGPLQGQLNAIFDAIAEGRKLPRVYPPPKQTDYNILVTTLEARGWSEADMQLFSDSRALAKATPEKVCQMVTDWFQSQLSVKDPDAQLRLLVDALKPVVAG
jgi:hypothetical protein